MSEDDSASAPQSRMRKAGSALLLAFCCFHAVFLIVSRTGTDLYLPFFSGIVLELGPLYYVFAMVLIVGFGNAVNLTDGLDGLATFPVIME